MPSFAEIKAQRVAHQQELLTREEEERKAQAATIEQERLQSEQQKKEALARANQILETDPRYQEIKAILDPKQNPVLFEALEAVWQQWFEVLGAVRQEWLQISKKFLSGAPKEKWDLRRKTPFRPKIILPQVTEIELVTRSRMVTKPVYDKPLGGDRGSGYVKEWQRTIIGEREEVEMYKLDSGHVLDFQDEELKDAVEETLKTGGVISLSGGKHIGWTGCGDTDGWGYSRAHREISFNNFVLVVNTNPETGIPRFHLGEEITRRKLATERRKSIRFDTQDELLIYVADKFINAEEDRPVMCGHTFPEREHYIF